MGYKVNIQKSEAFVYTNDEILGRQISKNPICFSNEKNKVPKNKSSQVGKRPVLRKLHDTEERN